MDFLQYVDMDSYLHRLNPLTKFFYFIAMAVLTSLLNTGVAITFLMVAFIVIWATSHIGKYIFLLLKKMKFLMIFIAVLWLIIGLFQINDGAVIFRTALGPVNLSLEWFDLYKSYVLAVRIFLMVSSFYTVIISTNFSEIILGLRKAHVPYPVAFGIGLVFQIIPMIIKEFYAIMDAQSSRGLEVQKCGAAAKMRNYITVAMPLFFRVLSKGHAISLAMHYYKLNFKVKRTSYKTIRSSWRDAVFFVVVLALIAASVILQILFAFGV